MPKASIAVFDIGNVLIRWDPRYLYRKLFTDEAAMERFLAEVCSPAWNLEQDRGRSFADAVAQLVEAHPDEADLIRAFDERWEEMIPGPIEGSVAILERLRRAGTRTFAITNFSNEKYAITEERFDFLGGFEDVVVSAREGVIKPDAAIYRLLLDRHGLDPAECVFIDDMAYNAEGARAVGMNALHFTDPEAMAAGLAALGIKGA